MVPKGILSLVIGLTLVILFGVACSKPRVRIIEHPRPKLTVDWAIFDTRDKSVTELKCGMGISRYDMYGGLEPNYPVALCSKEWESGDQCLRESGNRFAHLCERVLVYQDGTFESVGTREELRDLFAPIESPDEALSFALLTTDYRVKYDPRDYRLEIAMSGCDPGPEHYRYYTDLLEDTHVVEVENGYQVYLFDGYGFGCAPHTVWSVIVQVSHDGAVSEHSRTKLYEEDMTGPGNVVLCCVD